MLSQFVGNAAPGETAAISRDIDILSSGSNAAKVQVATELAKHNEASLRVVKVKDFSTILSKYNSRGINTYYSRGFTFKVDPASGITSSIESSEPLAAKAQSLLSKLEKYGKEHYANPVVDVFPTDSGLALVLVGEKLSPRNFFNGAWAAQYQLSESTGLNGTIKVDVHYFEDGNVRLKANHAVKIPSSSDAIKDIEEAENKFQQDLTAELAQLNEKQFKALRRQLPVTRAQMVWSKATAGYKIGSELESNRND